MTKNKELSSVKLWFLIAEWCKQKAVSPFNDYWYQKAKTELTKEYNDKYKRDE